MIKFAIEKKPAGSQLVLATGDLHGVEVPGRLIEPNKLKSLLSEEHYIDVYDFVLPFLNASISE
jgi:hypothetical protein